MNRKGQGGIFVIIAIMIFIIGMVSVNLIKPDVTTLRSATGLNCVNASAISDGTKLTCLAVDITIPWIIVSIFAVTGSLIITKFIKAKR
ncbi:hypothetical protein LCGC14_0509450 [marine sediment metagenome]|uniref:Uncharacterized protein n=1 Tax=marine sediment metagenome TaxID=412755 RepID=A0A0F9S6E9_9ZZZZ|nr:hypothetical protein [bacterium]